MQRKPTGRFNAITWAYGKENEEKLHDIIESFCGETITKTKELYDSMDFESASYFIELKSRTPSYYPDKLATWLLPCCKVDTAKNNKKKTLFFYYFSSTDELYILEYEPAVFNKLDRVVPDWHADGQEHYYVPRDDWALIEVTYA